MKASISPPVTKVAMSHLIPKFTMYGMLGEEVRSEAVFPGDE
jgi:hypothetical protein